MRKNGDFIDALIRIIDRIPPYSARAQIVAAICVVVAAMARAVVGMTGSDQRFVTYYPAIMAASLLANVPAGISVAVGATLITWLVLIPPLMSRPTKHDYRQPANEQRHSAEASTVAILYAPSGTTSLARV